MQGVHMEENCEYKLRFVIKKFLVYISQFWLFSCKYEKKSQNCDILYKYNCKKKGWNCEITFLIPCGKQVNKQTMFYTRICEKKGQILSFLQESRNCETANLFFFGRNGDFKRIMLSELCPK